MSRPGQIAPRLAALVIIASVGVVFAPTVGYEFVNWDDNQNIYENPHLNPPTVAAFAQFWRQPYFDLYIPLTRTLWTALAFVAQRTRGLGEGDSNTSPSPLTTLDPRPFHAANLVVHTCNALLVYALLCTWLASPWAACAGACFFALHPLQVEPVAWITGMKDLLGAMGALGALVLDQRRHLPARPASLASQGRLRSPRFRSLLRLLRALGHRRCVSVLAPVVFALGLLSKPTVAVLPLLLLWLDVTFAGVRFGNSLRRLVPWFLLAGASLALNALAQPFPAAIPSWYERVVVAADAIVFYARKLLLPFELGIDYARTPSRVLSNNSSHLLVALPLVAVAGAWLWRKRVPWLGVALGMFLLALLPTLGLVPFGFQDVSTVADRYAYWAILGPALTVAALWRATQRSMVRVVACVALCGLGLCSFLQQRHWRDAQALFEHGLEVEPRSRIAQYNLSTFRVRQGDYAHAAVGLGQLVVRDPNDFQAQATLGRVLVLSGRRDSAWPHYRKALELDPDNFDLLLDVAQLYVSQQEYEPGFELFRRALQVQPQSTLGHYRYGNALAAAGQFAAAAREYEAALQQDPAHTGARQNLARVRAHQRLEADP